MASSSYHKENNLITYTAIITDTNDESLMANFPRLLSVIAYRQTDGQPLSRVIIGSTLHCSPASRLHSLDEENPTMPATINTFRQISLSCRPGFIRPVDPTQTAVRIFLSSAH